MKSWEDDETKLAADELADMSGDLRDLTLFAESISWLMTINPPKGKDAWVALKKALRVPGELDPDISRARIIRQQRDAAYDVYSRHILNPLRDKPLSLNALAES